MVRPTPNARLEVLLGGQALARGEGAGEDLSAELSQDPVSQRLALEDVLRIDTHDLFV